MYIIIFGEVVFVKKQMIKNIEINIQTLYKWKEQVVIYWPWMMDLK